jgi:hypothetical protein
MTFIAIPGAPMRPVVDGRLALTLAGHDRF